MTEEERQKKGAEFLKEYGELVAKHGMDLATYPVWVPDGTTGFKTIIQSLPVAIPPPEPVKSTFMESK